MLNELTNQKRQLKSDKKSQQIIKKQKWKTTKKLKKKTIMFADETGLVTVINLPHTTLVSVS